MQHEIIAQYHCECGEGPMWHTTERRLYWSDIPTGRMFRFDPASNKHEQIYSDRQVGGYTFQEDGSLLLFRDKGNVALWRDGKVMHTVIDELEEAKATRFNDVAADPDGRVFCGTMPSHDKATNTRTLGKLYRLDPDNSIRPLVHEVGCSNGIGWTADLSKMFFIDTPTGEVSVFDYDRGSGAITNRRTFAKITRGFPDGMTVDAEDGVWVALWGGNGVLHFDKHGTLVETIELPAKNVTSVMFGGDDFADLYITSAIGGDKNADKATAGALYRVRPGVRGKAEFRSKIRIGK